MKHKRFHQEVLLDPTDLVYTAAVAMAAAETAAEGPKGEVGSKETAVPARANTPTTHHCRQSGLASATKAPSPYHTRARTHSVAHALSARDRPIWLLI